MSWRRAPVTPAHARQRGGQCSQVAVSRHKQESLPEGNGTRVTCAAPGLVCRTGRLTCAWLAYYWALAWRTQRARARRYACFQRILDLEHELGVLDNAEPNMASWGDPAASAAEDMAIMDAFAGLRGAANEL